jgi:predicted  nucleic acid-binding Zn-ribbon protein
MASKQSKDSSSRKMEGEFRQLGKRLDGLIARSRGAEARARARYDKQIKALKEKQAKAKVALARLKRQSSAASGPLKAGIQRAWRDIEEAVKEATKRFRETS